MEFKQDAAKIAEKEVALNTLLNVQMSISTATALLSGASESAHYLLRGTSSGADTQVIGYAQEAKNSASKAMGCIQQAMQLIQSLSVMVKNDDS